MRVVVLVLLVGCGSDGASFVGKDEVPCGPSWARTPPVDGTCDSACLEMPAAAGPSCETTVAYNSGSGNYVCPTTFDFEGVTGCCLDIGMVGEINGVSEPKRQRRVFFLSCKS